ncbi:putative f-box domain-containing protein [Daldinia childiae]|uniref:putative f-box domain-containing protein n=1 Tax=Daldinia childiae TaxID=326645 RepID=UPI0014469994|nr:putative f-box domain-containing protein [Daldinia childiae]KAF3066378.1 putative f-box domain-containing protein [Daldinia childiae]
MASINSLPDEIVHHILLYVPPEETLSNIAHLSKRFNRVAHEPLLWRCYCEHNFKYWEASHHFKERLKGYLHDTDWRRLFLLRLGRNAYIARLLDGIVASRVSRLQKMEQICLYGYDAKDYLLSQCQAPDSVEDVLARRYYSCSVLDSIHRSLAIEEWAKYQKFAARRIDEDTPYSERLNCGMRLERALGAFDMFMLHDNEGDLDEITELLDDIADRFRSAHPYFDELTTRQKAIALTRWLRSNNMTGLNDPTEQTYRYLRNCLIGRALRDEHHPSLPIISAAIYSALASRLGLEAYPCALPSHVHATVLSRPGMTLDDQPLVEELSQVQDNMFLDPYTVEDEVPMDRIIDFLYRLGIHTGHDNLLNPTATDLIVMRTAQNIRASFTSFRTHERPFAQIIPMIELNRGDWARNLQPALYSMIWASIMMVPVLPESDEIRWDWQQDVRDLLSAFYEHFPEDAWLVEKYVCPMYDTFAAPSRRRNNWDLPSKSVRDQIKSMRRVDAAVMPARRRSELAKGVEVKYRVGQVFKHKRYEYHGLILGWTLEGSSLDDPLSPTQRPWCYYTQPYYRCMSGTDGLDQHLIAEDNIEIVDFRGGPEMLPPEIKDLMPMAGKFFKRWDGERGVFVSNMKEMYPED